MVSSTRRQAALRLIYRGLELATKKIETDKKQIRRRQSRAPLTFYLSKYFGNILQKTLACAERANLKLASETGSCAVRIERDYARECKEGTVHKVEIPIVADHGSRLC